LTTYWLSLVTCFST